MIIIGLGHRSGHGKDTFAGYMVEWLSYMRPNLKIVIQPWAWKLKEIAYDLYKHHGLHQPAFYDTPQGRLERNIALPNIGKTPVEIWVDLGEGIRHEVYENTWRDYVRNNIEADVIICPDTRKMSEAEVCDFTVKIWNSRVPNREGRSIDDELASYPWNEIIPNDMGFSELRGQANSYCSKLWSLK